MKIPFVDLNWQHQQIKDSLDERFKKIFSDSSFILGPEVKSFEESFATYLCVGGVAAVGSGTDALVLALEALGLEPGDEVVTMPTSFFASASAIVHAGGKPVFVDIDEATRGIDLADLARKVSDKTKVIIPVHLYGQPIHNLDQIIKFADERGIAVLEDACQAHGALLHGKRVGSFGRLSAFSFYPGKNLGAYGEGGAVASDDPALLEKVRMLRDHGCRQKYEHELVGYNSRLDSVQAAVLNEKLEHLDQWNELRVQAAEKYHQALADLKQIKIYPTLPETKSVYHLYMIRLLEWPRDDFIKFLAANGVAAGIHYPKPIHLQKAFSHLGYQPGDLPKAESFSDSIVSLPIFPGITEDMLLHVSQIIHQYAKNFGKN